MTHGYQVKEDGTDPFVDIALDAAEDVGKATLPGAFLVDMIPARKSVGVNICKCLKQRVTFPSEVRPYVAARWRLAGTSGQIQAQF